MKKTILLFIVSFFVLPLCAQFTAKMVFTTMGNERIFTVFSSNEGYRYEFDENSQKGVVIVKNDSQQVIILMPQQNMAMKSSFGSPMSMGNDPVGTYEYYKKEGTVKEIGPETINGIACIKSELWNIENDEYGESTQKMFSVWISDKYSFPIKIINHIDGSEDSSMELKDIESWNPDADSYSIPEGYQIMDMDTMKPKQ